MRHRDRILAYVHRFPGRDDDEIAQALKIAPRQTVNQTCRQLADEGLVLRRTGQSGKIITVPIEGEVAVDAARRPPAPKRPTQMRAPDATHEWFWEGNVCKALAHYLEGRGWVVLSQADTKSKARGIDLHVRRQTTEMVVEAKGYPSTMYRDPSRRHERKPTNPTLQAQHWYAHALLKALRMKSAYPAAVAGIALPDVPRYRALFAETSGSLERLGIAMYFISEAGAVQGIGAP